MRTLALVFAFVKESGKKQEDECKRYATSVRCSKQKYLALQLMFVKGTTKNHNASVNRVETGGENEEGDGTTTVQALQC